jgi:sarcosine oxidase gamma subunit
VTIEDNAKITVTKIKAIQYFISVLIAFATSIIRRLHQYPQPTVLKA